MWRPIASLALAGCIVLAVPAVAAPPAASPTLLHLSQTARRVVPRDRIAIEMRTEATGVDPRLVQAEVNRRMKAALGKAKSTPSVKAATGSYNTYRFTPTGPDGKPKPPDQWRTEQGLSLTGQNFPAALILAGVLQADGLVITGMRFDVAPATLRAQQAALTKEALSAIMARAGRVAAALGLKVDRIVNLTVGNAQEQGRSPYPMMMARAARAGPPPAVAPGESTVAVTVQAEIALTPKP